MGVNRPKLYLFYDEKCSLCISFNKAVKRMDVRNDILSMPLQSDKVTDLFPNLDRKYMEQNFTVCTDEGKIYHNEGAIKEIFILLPALKYSRWAYKLPGVNKGLSSVYRMVKRNRHRFCGSCR